MIGLFKWVNIGFNNDSYEIEYNKNYLYAYEGCKKMTDTENRNRIQRRYSLKVKLWNI